MINLKKNYETIDDVNLQAWLMDDKEVMSKNKDETFASLMTYFWIKLKIKTYILFPNSILKISAWFPAISTYIWNYLPLFREFYSIFQIPQYWELIEKRKKIQNSNI